MFAKLTSFTESRRLFGGRELEVRERLTKNATPWMTQTQVLQVKAGNSGIVEL
jgi:hypothetical protein